MKAEFQIDRQKSSQLSQTFGWHEMLTPCKASACFMFLSMHLLPCVLHVTSGPPWDIWLIHHFFQFLDSVVHLSSLQYLDGKKRLLRMSYTQFQLSFTALTTFFFFVSLVTPDLERATKCLFVGVVQTHFSSICYEEVYGAWRKLPFWVLLKIKWIKIKTSRIYIYLFSLSKY